MHVAPDQVPLRWPAGVNRTPVAQRRRRFAGMGSMTLRQRYLEALRELEVQMAQLSYSHTLTDPGVACYFSLYGNSCVVAIDTYNNTDANLARVVEMLAGLAYMRRAGLDVELRQLLAQLRIEAQIPAWCSFFGFKEIPERSLLEKAHKRMCFEAHPDRGGSQEQMREINENIEQARKYYEKTS